MGQERTWPLRTVLADEMLPIGPDVINVLDAFAWHRTFVGWVE